MGDEQSEDGILRGWWKIEIGGYWLWFSVVRFWGLGDEMEGGHVLM